MTCREKEKFPLLFLSSLPPPPFPYSPRLFLGVVTPPNGWWLLHPSASQPGAAHLTGQWLECMKVTGWGFRGWSSIQSPLYWHFREAFPPDSQLRSLKGPAAPSNKLWGLQQSALSWRQRHYFVFFSSWPQEPQLHFSTVLSCHGYGHNCDLASSHRRGIVLCKVIC